MLLLQQAIHVVFELLVGPFLPHVLCKSSEFIVLEGSLFLNQEKETSLTLLN